MRRARFYSALVWAALSVVLFACGAPSEDGGSTSSSSGAGGGLDGPVDQLATSPRLRDLGPNMRRASVVVLPGDAAVEVDGVGVRRRDGAVDIIGNLNEVRRFRIFKGLQAIEKDVTIGE